MIYIYNSNKTLIENKIVYTGYIDGRYPFILVVNANVNIFDYKTYHDLENYLDTILEQQHTINPDSIVNIEKPNGFEYVILSHHQKTERGRRPGYCVGKFPIDADISLPSLETKIPVIIPNETQSSPVITNFSMQPLETTNILKHKKKRLNDLLKHLYDTNTIKKEIEKLRREYNALKNKMFKINELSFTKEIDLSTISIDESIKLAYITHGDQYYLYGKDKYGTPQPLISLGTWEDIQKNYIGLGAKKIYEVDFYSLAQQHSIKYYEDETLNIISEILLIQENIQKLKKLHDQYYCFIEYSQKLIDIVPSEEILDNLEKNLFSPDELNRVKDITKVFKEHCTTQKNKLYASHMWFHFELFHPLYQLLSLCFAVIFGLGSMLLFGPVSCGGIIALIIFSYCSLLYPASAMIHNGVCVANYFRDEKRLAINTETSNAINSFGLLAKNTHEQDIADAISNINMQSI